MSPQFVYTGPSWAERSYDDPSKLVEPTNLAQQWGIECVDLSLAGASVMSTADAVENYFKTSPRLPIVWIYNEPILNIGDTTGLTEQEFLCSSDWENIWMHCNKKCLQRIASLGCPVLLIGAHSDIVDCDYPNITVAHPSWQKWLAEKAGFDVTNNQIHVKMYKGGNFNFEHCWGAEIVQAYIFNNPNIDPPDGLVKSVWDIMEFWRQLSRTGLFSGCHPTRLAHEEFAKFLLPTVTKFLQDNK
jgi:hypothetical protein